MEDNAYSMETKESLRNRIVLLRECMTVYERERASGRIFDHFFSLPEYQTAETVYAFAGFGSEVPTLNPVFKMINDGKRLALPKVLDEERIEFYEVCRISDIAKGKMGIPEPVRVDEPAPFKPDLFLMPGTVFGRDHYRLGYGRGYYDRFLASKGYGRLVWKIAVSYACQVVDTVPHEEWDIPVDMIITEHGIYR